MVLGPLISASEIAFEVRTCFPTVLTFLSGKNQEVILHSFLASLSILSRVIKTLGFYPWNKPQIHLFFFISIGTALVQNLISNPSLPNSTPCILSCSVHSFTFYHVTYSCYLFCQSLVYSSLISFHSLWYKVYFLMIA